MQRKSTSASSPVLALQPAAGLQHEAPQLWGEDAKDSEQNKWAKGRGGKRQPRGLQVLACASPAGWVVLAESRGAQVDGEMSWHGKTSLQISVLEQRICSVDVPRKGQGRGKGKSHLGAPMFLPMG